MMIDCANGTLRGKKISWLNQSAVCVILASGGYPEAYEKGRLMGSSEGILVGISSGAALHAAIEVAIRPENEGKTVVVLLPDTGDRYLSTPMFN